MSTKCTIGHGPKHHLFEECFEKDNVHLQLDSPQYETCRYDGEDSIRVAIPIQVWRQIVESWNDSAWGKDPTQDNQVMEFNIKDLD